MSKKILVLDIGDQNTKSIVFEIKDQIPLIFDLIHQESVPTTFGHPWDLADTCRVLIENAINYSPNVAIITSWGDGYVEATPKSNRFVTCDEPAKKPTIRTYTDQQDYIEYGFPYSPDMKLTSVYSKMQKHHSIWSSMLPPNVYVASAVLNRGGWTVWDETQASITGCYHLTTRKWANPIDGESPHPFCPDHKLDLPYPDGLDARCKSNSGSWAMNDGFRVCKPSHILGRYKELPIMIGGLNNAFFNPHSEMTPYIIAGTWLVIGQAYPKYQRPTLEHYENDVRWMIDAYGCYNAQTVRELPTPIDESGMYRIIDDLKAVSKQKCVRVFGDYANELCKDLIDFDEDYEFMQMDGLYQHKQIARFAHLNSQTT